MFNDDALLINAFPRSEFAKRNQDWVAARSLEMLRNQLVFSSMPVVLYDGQGNQIDFYSKRTKVGSIVNLAPPRGHVRLDVAARDVDPLPGA